MSIRKSTEVWEKSKQKGAGLLVMLAIADFANDDGFAWPSVPTLARKSRVTVRGAQKIVSNCIAAGELEVERGAGPRGTNLYHILLSQPQKTLVPTESPERRSGGEQHSDVNRGTKGANADASAGELPFARSVIDPSDGSVRGSQRDARPVALVTNRKPGKQKTAKTKTGKCVAGRARTVVRNARVCGRSRNRCASRVRAVARGLLRP